MRHPVEKYNVHQAEVLASLPEQQRAYMSRIFRIGNATYCYYNRSNGLSVFGRSDSDVSIGTIGSVEDLLDWLERRLSHQTESQSARELLAVYFNRSADAGISGGFIRRWDAQSRRRSRA